MEFGALLLAGGAARRMGGRNKALLTLDGRTFLDRLEEALAPFDEKLLSTRDPALAWGGAFRPVCDRRPGQGPLEGLGAALAQCRSDALVVACCDMPLFSGALALALRDGLGGRQALVCRDRAGRLHPLCGVYTKRCLPEIDALLSAGERRVRLLLERVDSGEFALAGTPFSDRLLQNINTPEELEALSGGGRRPGTRALRPQSATALRGKFARGL